MSCDRLVDRSAHSCAAQRRPYDIGTRDCRGWRHDQAGPLSIRIHGIDAPEQGQTCQQRNGRPWDCGSAATAAMAGMVDGKALECEPLDTDSYGRIIARCLAGDRDLGGEMAALGLAWAYREYSEDYAGVEAAARRQGIGIWQGTAEAPWEYPELRQFQRHFDPD